MARTNFELHVVASLRCIGCKRAPTKEERREMLSSFGHKLIEGDGPKLRWRCLACCHAARPN